MCSSDLSWREREVVTAVLALAEMAWAARAAGAALEPAEMAARVRLLSGGRQNVLF